MGYSLNSTVSLINHTTCNPSCESETSKSNSEFFYTLYLTFKGLEGAAVSDKDGVCVIAFAVEGKEARLDPLMRCA